MAEKHPPERQKSPRKTPREYIAAVLTSSGLNWPLYLFLVAGATASTASLVNDVHHETKTSISRTLDIRPTNILEHQSPGSVPSEVSQTRLPEEPEVSVATLVHDEATTSLQNVDQSIYETIFAGIRSDFQLIELKLNGLERLCRSNDLQEIKRRIHQSTTFEFLALEPFNVDFEINFNAHQDLVRTCQDLLLRLRMVIEQIAPQLSPEERQKVRQGVIAFLESLTVLGLNENPNIQTILLLLE